MLKTMINEDDSDDGNVDDADNDNEDSVHELDTQTVHTPFLLLNSCPLV